MITFVPNIYTPTVFETQALESALEDIRAGRFRATIENYRANPSKDLKARLPSWAFNGTFNGSVVSANLAVHSNIFHFDIDNLEGDLEVHKQILACIPGMLFCFVSTSGTGIKGGVALFHGCVKGDDDLKAIYPYFRALFAEWGYTLDDTCKDVRRLCFVSYDPTIYINADVDPVTPDRVEPKINSDLKSELPPKQFDPLESAHCIQKVCNILLEAVPGTKHHARNRAGSLAGGYIAAGVVDEEALMKELHRVSHVIDPKGRAPKTEVDTLNDAVDAGRKLPVSDTGYCPPVDVSEIDWGVVEPVEAMTALQPPKPPTLLDLIPDDNILKRLSREVCAATNLPEGSVFMTGTSVFSSLAMRKYGVAYRSGHVVPLGLYVVAEQPSGTSKTRSLEIFQKPFVSILQEVKNSLKKEIDALLALEDKGSPELKALQLKHRRACLPIFTTNSTPEALDPLMNETNGFFSAVSSEKGLLNTLLGITYSDKTTAKNNDTVLYAYNGSYVCTGRAGRDGYSGFPVGNIAAFAQEGTIEALISADAASGLAERFFMLSEPSSLGTIDHHKFYSINRDVLKDYAEACDFYRDVLENGRCYHTLQPLSLSASAWYDIEEMRNVYEPHIAPGEKYSYDPLIGSIRKIDMQVMKLAGNLHVATMPRNFVEQIPDELVKAAIGIVDLMIKKLIMSCEKVGHVGTNAEETAILNGFDRFNTRTLKQLKESRKCVPPFKGYSGNKAAVIAKRIQMMLESKALGVRIEKGVEVYYVAK